MIKDVLNWSGAVGVIILAVGLLIGSIVTSWPPLLIAVVVLGAALISLWIATHLTTIAEFAGLRSTQDNANILVSIVAAVMILILVNILGVRFEAKLDLTEEGLFTLSPQTVKVIKELPSPVKVWAVTTLPSPELRQVLERYAKVNPSQFKFEFVNPRNSPAETRRLEVRQDNTLVIEAGSRKQQVANPSPAELEADLTAAILKVTDTQSLKAVFIQGHGELSLEAAQSNPGLSQAVADLRKEGYTTEGLNLTKSEKGDIPADAGLVVIAGSEKAFLPGEIETLKTYLEQGGRLLVMLRPQTEINLDPILNDWGVTANKDIIVDQLGEQLFRSGPFVALGTTYAPHPITEDIAQQSVVTLFPLAQSLKTTNKEGIVATALVQTSPQGNWGETSVDLTNFSATQVKFDANVDNKPPLTIGVALSRSQDKKTDSDEEAGSESRLVVFGNADFAVDGNFTQQGNRDLFLNTINWLADQNQRISIRAKSPTNRRFDLTPQEVLLVTLVSLIGLPALALGSGIYLWTQRR
jgi:ABC-type uncharacterized transport system involved in gliding motility auxiliary subunit